MLTRALRWARTLLARRRLEREMQTEMAEHIERATARLRGRGLSERDARAAAHREFGNVTAVQEEGRAARGWHALYVLSSDLRFGCRLFLRKPATTFTIVFVLAMGMSLGAALFSFVHSYATQPPPAVPHADDMVRIRGTLRIGGDAIGRAFSADEVRAQRALPHFRLVSAWVDHPALLGAGGDAELRTEPGTVTFVSEEYFDVLGVRPVVGTGLAPGDFAPDAPLAGVVSHAMWQGIFGARRDIVGRTVVADGVHITIVGIAPPRFSGVSTFNEMKVWVPLAAQARLVPASVREGTLLRTAARLNPGVSLAEATAAVAVVADRARDASRTLAGGAGARRRDAPDERPIADVVPLIATSGDPNFEKDIRVMTACFTVLGLLVLLVTCTNVSSLITGLGITRRKEVAVRLSLGAARGRIIRQLLTESTLLAVAAGVAALGVLALMDQAIVRFAPPLPISIRVSPAATVFTFGLSLAVGIAFGLSPALHATRLSVAGVLKESASMITGAGTRLQRALVVAQIAFTQPLVVGVATLLLGVFTAYERQGFTPAAEQIVAMKLRLSRNADGSVMGGDGASDARATRARAARLRARLARTPGVVRVVAEGQGSMRFDQYGVHRDDRVAGGSTALVRMAALRTNPGFFEVMGIPLVAGEDFVAADSTPAGLTPVIIGDALARQLFADANPIGRRLVPLADDPDAPAGARPTLVIRGVADQNDEDPRAAHDGHRVSIPSPGPAGDGLAMLVRTRGDAGPMLPTLRRITQEEIPNVASIDARTVADLQADIRNAFTLVASVLSIGGAIALLIAAIGLYAVVALSVGQRTGEIAVRMAVGARATQIARRFIGDGVRLGAVGLVIGLPLSLIGLRIVLSIPELIPPVGIGRVGVIAGGCVLLVAVVAAVIPARRAARVDPAIVLRGE